MVGAVGEMASMKRRKLWKTGGGWSVLLQQCHPNSAGSLITARRTEYNPPLFLFSLCVVSCSPNWEKRPRYIDSMSGLFDGVKISAKLSIQVNVILEFKFLQAKLKKERKKKK